MTAFEDIVPVFPVRDVAAAAAHYRNLGFEVRHYEGGAYAYANRDRVNIHLSQFAELDPASSESAAYLYVTDADALYAEWTASGAAGRFNAPVDTDYGRREGAHVDPDGNLLRYGSPLA